MFGIAKVDKVGMGYNRLRGYDLGVSSCIRGGVRGVVGLAGNGWTACLPNAAIFEELARMGAKTTAWNEFSSTMAPAIICLANNQKFNFSKYIRENMVKNLEAGVKFFMFPRFIQVFVNHQIAPKKVGDIPSDTQDTPIVTQPSTFQPQKKHKPRRKQRKETKVSQDEPPTKEHIPTPSHDPIPSGEDRLKLNELMEICTKLSGRVLYLEQTKTNQAAKIEKLKKRVKQLEDKEGSGDQEDASKQGRIAEIDADKDLSLINKTIQDQERINDQDLFGLHDLDGDEVFVDVTTGENVEHDAKIAKKVVTTIEDIEVTFAATTTPQIFNDELTLAQTLMEIKAAKPKAKGVQFKIQVNLEKHHFHNLHRLKAKVARILEAEMKDQIDEEERIAKEKNKANIAMIEEWDDVHATIDSDRQLAEQIQAQEREQLSINERSKLLVELIESRRKYFAVKRAEEIINKPPTKAQQNSLIYCERTLKKTQAEVTEGGSKRAGEEEPRRATPPPTVQSQDKGKGKMVEPEPISKNLIKAQIQRDAEIAQMLFEEEQAQFEREQRIAREKVAEQKAKDVALIKQIEDVQARIDVDALLAERLQEEEREQFTVDEQARMLVDLIAERKRFFAAQRAEQIQNKPPTKAQLRNKMEMLSRILNRRLEIDHESEMALELIRFIKTQLKE
nr:hypothetical protein [Tanacetum cinerariifolium]